MSYLTVPVCEKKKKDFSKRIDKLASSGAVALELRFDCLSKFDHDNVRTLTQQASKTGLKVICTCRDPREGGENDLSEAFRMSVLREAALSGADFIDCEFANFEANFKELYEALTPDTGCRLILSAHNFEGRFENLRGQYDKMQEAAPEAVIKIAYQADNINQCFECFDVLKVRRGDAVILAMGDAGKITRILAPKIGSFFCYASKGGKSTAPGQIPLKQMKKFYRFKDINEDSNLYGIIASPVEHSMSPLIYNKTFKKEASSSVFLPLLLEEGAENFNTFLDNVLSRPWLSFKGFSVTLPHKTNAFQYAARKGELTERAKKIGAVNTLKTSFLIGENTDCSGAQKPLEEAAGDLNGLKTAVLGAGGAAKAVVAALTDKGAEVTIFNRTLSKAESLAEQFGCKACQIGYFPMGEAFEAVVNCTSLGMSPKVEACPIDTTFLQKGCIVFDTVYNPPETRLLKEARHVGARPLGGIEMFVQQAVEQYNFLTGREMDKAYIRKKVLKKIKQ
ncbi:Shikimate dehydrogenase [Sedimentisphaera cyanobacteriorum]|uniref:Shikimate dehydrogenase (NADP(+)) n=1 Tax=Sedimentisphaera cyanobacteriorum TaxID=1940790 RepID=A0A1Q2HQ79_9BACT|nr:shikimate dehydrogenase [Sedimentisphaera cyanobacteriorum]AQQ09619.1 Shikimate dehydrogenase [Sedimentisphaera cyanobacteriorum]